MNPVLNKNTFLVKEHVGMLKAANNYDVLDPNTEELLLTCREDNLGLFTKMLRFSDYKRMTPFDITIKSADGEILLRVRRGVSVFFSMVEVFNGKDECIGYFKQRLSFGGKFDVLDSNQTVQCTLKGDWASWEFNFSKDGIHFAQVSKKWAGFSREIFTSADNYILIISDKIPENNPIRLLIVAAVFCIDMVLKE